MYGEDIDLSYRIQQAGYKNYYYGKCTIIHFKGESTRKTSVNYVRMFYLAMSRFVQKHYSSSSAGAFKIVINLAIFMRALLSVIKRFIQQTGLPLLDALLIFLSFWSASYVWTQYIKTETVYSQQLLLVSFGVFTLLFLIVSYYTGLYEKRFRFMNLWRSTVISLLINLAIYSLLPERLRFSRGMIVAGSVFSYMILIFWRWVLLRTDVLKSADNENEGFLLVAGTGRDLDKVNTLLKQSGRLKPIQAFISPLDEVQSLGKVNDIKTLLASTPAKELILCESADLSFQQIISLYEQNGKKVNLRLHASNSECIVGSDSKNEAGYVLNSKQYALALAINLRLKRLIDLSAAFLLLITFPLHFIFNKQPLLLLQNSLQVFIGKKTWVGFFAPHKHLPYIKPSVLGVTGLPHGHAKLTNEGLLIADEWYAYEYKPLYDLRTILFNYKKLGSK